MYSLQHHSSRRQQPCFMDRCSACTTTAARTFSHTAHEAYSHQADIRKQVSIACGRRSCQTLRSALRNRHRPHGSIAACRDRLHLLRVVRRLPSTLCHVLPSIRLWARIAQPLTVPVGELATLYRQFQTESGHLFQGHQRRIWDEFQASLLALASLCFRSSKTTATWLNFSSIIEK